MNSLNKNKTPLTLMLGGNYPGTCVLGAGFPTIHQQEKGSRLLFWVSQRSSPSFEAPGAHFFLANTGDLRQQVEMDVAPGLVSSGHHCVQFPGQSWRRS